MIQRRFSFHTFIMNNKVLLYSVGCLCEHVHVCVCVYMGMRMIHAPQERFPGCKYLSHSPKQLVESGSRTEGGGSMGHGIAVSGLRHTGSQIAGTHAYQRGQPVLVTEVWAGTQVSEHHNEKITTTKMMTKNSRGGRGIGPAGKHKDHMERVKLYTTQQ